MKEKNQDFFQDKSELFAFLIENFYCWFGLNMSTRQKLNSQEESIEQKFRVAYSRKDCSKTDVKMIFNKNFMPKPKRNIYIDSFYAIFLWPLNQMGRKEKIMGRILFLKKEMKKNLVEDG